MLPANKNVIAITPQSVTAAGTASSDVLIDTKGWDYVNISVFMDSANVVSNTLSVLKVEEGDTTSSVATFAGCVSGTDYTIATNAYTTTSNQNIWSFNINTGPRKRYLKVSASPRTTNVIGAVATLSRGEKGPTTAAEAGVLNAVYV
jgi:hypothetical protein